MIELGVNIIGWFIVLILIVTLYHCLKAEHQSCHEPLFHYLYDQTCSICLCNKTNQTILPCGHSFCKECVVRLWEQNEDEPIVCPLCRRLATFMRKERIDVNDEDIEKYNGKFSQWKNRSRILKKYGINGLKLLALSPFLSILFLRVLQVLLGLSYIAYFVFQPICTYILKPHLQSFVKIVSQSFIGQTVFSSTMMTQLILFYSRAEQWILWVSREYCG